MLFQDSPPEVESELSLQDIADLCNEAWESNQDWIAPCQNDLGVSITFDNFYATCNQQIKVNLDSYQPHFSGVSSQWWLNAKET